VTLNANEIAARSTKPSDILPLITIWSQVPAPLMEQHVFSLIADRIRLSPQIPA
jgi:hypothetical protein